MGTDNAVATPESVASLVRRRGIEQVLHFTTNRGLVGIFANGAVLCRDKLETSEHIEHIYTPNCADRLKDPEWTGYVNLSISRVNDHMFGASNNWHASKDVWWVVLSFTSDLLTDPGVHFATTNNTYPCVRRGSGASGLEALFAPSVEWGYYGSVKRRSDSMPDNHTTDVQAEVLYPDEVSLDHLQAVYVHEPEHEDQIHGLVGTFDRPRVDIAWKEAVFG